MLDDTIRNKIEYYCAYQERCHTEVKSKLIELKCPYEDIDEYISYLIENNFLNEQRYAEQFSLGKFHSNKWGKKKIAYQLRQKKISDYCIRKGLEAIDETEYEETIAQLIHRKALDYRKDKTYVKRQKIYQYMIQKGYESDLILIHTQSLE